MVDRTAACQMAVQDGEMLYVDSQLLALSNKTSVN
jgi:hypothetical protein